MLKHALPQNGGKRLSEDLKFQQSPERMPWNPIFQNLDPKSQACISHNDPSRIS